MKPKELSSFFGHLADMLSVGIPLKEAILYFKFKQRKLGKEIVRCMEHRGLGFAESLLKVKQFPSFVCSTVKAGESGGKIADALIAVKTAVDDDMDFKTHLKKTLFMPVINLAFVFATVIFLATNTLPKLEGAISNLGNIPDFSKQVFRIAAFIKINLFFIIGVAVGSMVLLGFWIRSAPPILLKVPLVGPIMRYRFIISFFSRLHLIHSAGLPLNDAMKIIEKTEDGVFRDVIRKGIKKLDRGKQLQDIFSDPIYPSMLMQMVHTGSIAGKLDATFRQIVQIYSKDLKQQTDKVSTVLEPVSLIVVGCVLTLVMLSVMYPIISATDTMGTP